jgi:hypothetical protein
MGVEGDGAGDFYIRTLMRPSIIRKNQRKSPFLVTALNCYGNVWLLK